jgi:hypothetical protein
MHREGVVRRKRQGDDASVCFWGVGNCAELLFQAVFQHR